ncbi:hypothetical protein DV736_g2141, partial [Chaetothyriales sp. CBS 134916]
MEVFGEDCKRAEKMREAFAGEAELRAVMDYINGPVNECRVLAYIEVNGCEIADGSIPMTSNDNDQFYSNFKRQRQRYGGSDQALPKLGALIRQLQSKTDTFLQHVAESLRKSLLLSHAIELLAAGKKIECRIFISPSANAQQFGLHIVSTLSADRVGISHTSVTLDNNGIFQRVSISHRALSLPAVDQVYDAKWAPDGSLMMRAGAGSDRQLLRYTVVEASEGRQRIISKRELGEAE